jgi:hypothetical protein
MMNAPTISPTLYAKPFFLPQPLKSFVEYFFRFFLGAALFYVGEVGFVRLVGGKLRRVVFVPTSGQTTRGGIDDVGDFLRVYLGRKEPNRFVTQSVPVGHLDTIGDDSAVLFPHGA